MKTKNTPTFRSLIEQLMRRHDAHKVFAAFTHMTACALADGTREPEYLDEAKRWKRDELEVFSAMPSERLSWKWKRDPSPTC